MPSALSTTASTGLSFPAWSAARGIASATSSAPATIGGTKRTISASRPGIGEQRRDHRLVGGGGRRARACRRGSRRWPRREAAASSAARVSAASSGSSSPCASQASAQRMPSPPAFVTTPTRLPCGSGWLESSAAASISSSSVRARRTPAWRKSASTARSEVASAAVCELAALRAGVGAAGLQREDRLAPRDAVREPRKRARVAERLDVEQHEVGAVVLVPPLEQIVRRDIRLVPDRDEAREAEAARRRPPRAAPGRARRSATRSRCVPAAAAGRRRSPRGARSTRRCRGSSGRRASRRGRAPAPAAAPAARRPRRRPRRSPPRSRRARGRRRRAPTPTASSAAAAGTQTTARSTGSSISAIER